MAHHEQENYMFFKNLQQIARQAEMLHSMDPAMLDQILQQGDEHERHTSKPPSPTQNDHPCADRHHTNHQVR